METAMALSHILIHTNEAKSIPAHQIDQKHVKSVILLESMVE
jgi:hypothetical protein